MNLKNENSIWIHICINVWHFKLLAKMIRIFLLCIDLKKFWFFVFTNCLLQPTPKNEGFGLFRCQLISSFHETWREATHLSNVWPSKTNYFFYSWYPDPHSIISFLWQFFFHSSIYLFIYFLNWQGNLFARPLGDLLALTIRYDNKGKT